MDEIAVREELDQQFGKLPEPEQPAPLGVQALAVSLQEAAPMEEERMDEESEAAPPREARGTTPILDFAKLMVSMLERQEVTTPPVLPPVLEQAAPADVEMAEEETEETATEEPEEGDVLGDAQFLFGKKDNDLMQGERANLEEWRKQWAAQKKLDAQVEQDAQLQAQLQAEEEAKAARSAKKRDAQVPAQELEATHHAFADIPLDTEQERMSDEDLDEQRSLLLANKAASEELTQAEALHDQAERDKERQAASLREIERHTEGHLEQFQKDQEMLRNIEIDEQKVRATKLQVEAGQREAQECDKVLEQIQAQKIALLEQMPKRKKKADEEWDRRIWAGEEKS